ncbi:MAG: hypothetical protein K2Q97_14865 [Burkholderiaceae bacterium]|nr:hypothetical protein [Burkholderiaceae bacterium]
MFKSFYTALPDDRRTAFAEAAGTTTGYIESHLIAPAHRRKVPNKPLMDRLSAACGQFGADFSKEQLLAYFYETPVEAGEAAA